MTIYSYHNFNPKEWANIRPIGPWKNEMKAATKAQMLTLVTRGWPTILPLANTGHFGEGQRGDLAS